MNPAQVRITLLPCGFIFACKCKPLPTLEDLALRAPWPDARPGRKTDYSPFSLPQLFRIIFFRGSIRLDGFSKP